MQPAHMIMAFSHLYASASHSPRENLVVETVVISLGGRDQATGRFPAVWLLVFTGEAGPLAISGPF